MSEPVLKAILRLFAIVAKEDEVTQQERDYVLAFLNDHLGRKAVMENIAFFDVQADPAHAEYCARLVQLHVEIARMPMGYQTLVGDLGSGLSGGQKQRLMLARALYKRPSVLALDEATSHLDVPNERAVALALGQLQLTRLIIAHRPETIAGAQRVVQMRDGQVLVVVRAVEAPGVESSPSQLQPV